MRGAKARKPGAATGNRSCFVEGDELMGSNEPALAQAAKNARSVYHWPWKEKLETLGAIPI